jgi:hypothetical protein
LFIGSVRWKSHPLKELHAHHGASLDLRFVRNHGQLRGLLLLLLGLLRKCVIE